MTKPKRVGPKEAAEILGMSPQTLANWRSMGGGPRWLKVGGRVFYEYRELNEFRERGIVPRDLPLAKDAERDFFAKTTEQLGREVSGHEKSLLRDAFKAGVKSGHEIGAQGRQLQIELLRRCQYYVELIRIQETGIRLAYELADKVREWQSLGVFGELPSELDNADGAV